MLYLNVNLFLTGSAQPRQQPHSKSKSYVHRSLSHKNCYRAFASSGQRTAPKHACNLHTYRRYKHQVQQLHVSTLLEHAVSLLRRRLSWEFCRCCWAASLLTESRIGGTQACTFRCKTHSVDGLVTIRFHRKNNKTGVYILILLDCILKASLGRSWASPKDGPMAMLQRNHDNDRTRKVRVVYVVG